MKKKLIIIYIFTFFIHLIFISVFSISYDEAAYAYTANQLAHNGDWFQLYGRDDLFFFPPLFNYITAFFIQIGFDRIYAVRTVSLIFSSLISPLLFFLTQLKNNSEKSSWIAVALWLIFPLGFNYSVIGQVETAMLAMILCAAFFLYKSLYNSHTNWIIFTAFSLGAAIWIKETAFGIIPVFLYFLLKNKKKLLIFSATIGILIIPLIIQSFMPHKYDLFFEITTPRILWNNISVDAVLSNITLVNGINMSSDTMQKTVQFIFFVLIIFPLFSLSIERIKNHFFLHFSTITLMIFIPFFIIFPKKFPYYMILVWLFFIPILSAALSKKILHTSVLLLFLFACSIPNIISYSEKTEENSYREALKFIQHKQPDASVAMPLPRVAEYIAQKENLSPKIVTTDWFNCYKDANSCLLSQDYVLADDYFLLMLFCKSWPMSKENCDYDRHKETLRNLQLIKKWQTQRLYKVKKNF